jgi:hypothetical protein
MQQRTSSELLGKQCRSNEEIMMKALRKALAKVKPRSPFEAILLATLLLLAVGFMGLVFTLGDVFDANLALADSYATQEKALRVQQQLAISAERVVTIDQCKPESDHKCMGIDYEKLRKAAEEGEIKVPGANAQ